MSIYINEYIYIYIHTYIHTYIITNQEIYLNFFYGLMSDWSLVSGPF